MVILGPSYFCAYLSLYTYFESDSLTDTVFYFPPIQFGWGCPKDGNVSNKSHPEATTWTIYRTHIMSHELIEFNLEKIE